MTLRERDTLTRRRHHVAEQLAALAEAVRALPPDDARAGAERAAG